LSICKIYFTFVAYYYSNIYVLMKTSYLFPYRFKKISGIVFLFIVLLFFLSLCFDILSYINLEVPVFAIIGDGRLVFNPNDTNFFKTHYFSFIYNEILDEVVFFILITSGVLYAFSKEEKEDELIAKIRLNSLVWATYFNAVVSLICYLFFYGLTFLYVMDILIFSHLLFFVIRFRWAIYKYNKDFDEK